MTLARARARVDNIHIHILHQSSPYYTIVNRLLVVFGVVCVYVFCNRKTPPCRKETAMNEKILQIIPAPADMWAVFEGTDADGNGYRYRERVACLALTEWQDGAREAAEPVCFPCVSPPVLVSVVPPGRGVVSLVVRSLFTAVPPGTRAAAWRSARSSTWSVAGRTWQRKRRRKY